uniref:DNA-directed DNA polymerase n=2 Tax=viral metagenome TaxID=1070528 RepID=A0A6M3L2V9_9ZZZZ
MPFCSRCRWCHNEEGINCTGYFGPDDAEIVFAGEVFGRNEAEVGEAFVGEAGKKLDLLLELAGLTRKKVVIMNMLRCYQRGNPTPTEKELDLCFPFTFRDLNIIKPKLIVAMGRSAFYSLTGIKDAVTPYVGRLIQSDKISHKVWVTWHPAATLYDLSKWEILEEHFRMIPSLIGQEPKGIKNYSYINIDTIEKFHQVKFEIAKSGHLYLDLEATGLNPYTEGIRTIQLGIDGGVIYVFTIFEEVKGELKTLIESKGIVGAGFEFDHKFLKEKLDIDIINYDHDVVLGEYILTGMKDNDLTFLTGKYAPESYGYDKKVNAVGGAHKVFNIEELKQYGANDVGVMYPIRKAQRKELAVNNQLWLFENITMPSNKVLTKMSIRGVQYDVDQLWKVDKIYENKAKKLLYSIESESYIGEVEAHFKRKFNPRSYDMIQWLLLEYFKLPVLKTTKKESPSIGKGEMKRYAEQFKNPYCLVMEKYRSIQNIRDNFLSGTVSKLHNGVAHTRYSLHATASGRPNSKDPNLLNVPRLKEIKECIIARPGCKFIQADLSQIEVRVAAVVYDDQNLIDICNTEGKDFHCLIAAKANNIPYDKFYTEYTTGNKKFKEMRQAAKSLTFGVLYQEGPQKLAYELGISREKAEKFIEDYFKGFPDLKNNIEKQKQFVIDNGYVSTYFNFRRYFKYHREEDHETLRQAVNTPIQGTAWNILQLALVDIDKRIEGLGLESRLVLQVYDSIVVETKEGEIDVVARLLKDSMEGVIKPFEGLNRVKLKADVEVGPNLADMSAWKF